MKILITGANGQLGTELQKLLKQEKNCASTKVCAVDLPDLDITKLNAVNSFVQNFGPDVIINCAAFTNVDACETEKDTAFAVNAIGPRNLAMAAKQAGAKLMHISTDYIFSGEGTIPYSEYDLAAPKSIYGLTKYQGEQYVTQFCSQYFIVRTAWLYGYTGANFVKTVLRILREKGTISVVNDQRGNPTNAEDLARHLLLLAAGNEYGVYHCTNNGECSWFDFATEIARLSGIPSTVIPCTTAEFPRPAQRPVYSSLENRMLRLSGKDFMRTWQNAIADYMQHYNKESGEIEL